MTDFGEPWKLCSDEYVRNNEGSVVEKLDNFPSAQQRMIACVNSCAGFDPAEMRHLAVAMKILLKYRAFDCMTLCEGEDEETKFEHVAGAIDGECDENSIIAAARRLGVPELALLNEKGGEHGRV
jgi:hypothetical protein